MKSEGPILICPLDWGLGHATRDIPIVRQFLKQQQKVIIAGCGESLELLKLEFPDCDFADLPGIKIKYSAGKYLVWKMLFQLPAFYKSIEQEHIAVQNLVAKYQPSLIVSDNRYGAWHPHIRSVLVTHQLKLKLPKAMTFFERFIQSRLKRMIEKFDECWIPDHEGDRSLAGELSHVDPMPRNARYIGYLSRFSPHAETKSLDYVLAIVSGPEPQRQMLVDRLKTLLSHLNISSILITGKVSDGGEFVTENNLKIAGHVSSQKMEHLVRDAKLVICRSGYSSLMDLVRLRKKAIIIPTPGQTEQEYLAGILNGKCGLVAVKQNDVTFEELIQRHIHEVSVVKCVDIQS